MNVTETKSLFNRLGGTNAVNAAVDRFYSKVMADNRISHFFTSTDMKTQATKQKAFLAHVFGASTNYTGKSMREAHAGMRLTEEHFNAVAGHLIATLTELQVPQSLISEVVAVVLPTKEDIVAQ